MAAADGSAGGDELERALDALGYVAFRPGQREAIETLLSEGRLLLVAPTGDGKSLSIASASILAKVTRDREMIEIQHQFPAYGFARHKGYGTHMHQEKLREFGPSPIHRRSFRPVEDLLRKAAT